MTPSETVQWLLKVTKILKSRFPNLTAENVIEIAGEILQAVNDNAKT